MRRRRTRWTRTSATSRVRPRPSDSITAGALRRDGDRLAFAAPPLRRGGPLPDDDVALIARGLGVDRADILHHAWCDNGPNWRGVMLRSAEQVLALRPDATVLASLDIGVVGPRGKVGVVGARADDDECAFEVRAFFPGNQGLVEDPVTGSAHCTLAPFWAERLHRRHLRGWQASARGGSVEALLEGDRVRLLGAAVTIWQGELVAPPPTGIQTPIP